MWPLALAETLADAESIGRAPAPEPALLRILDQGADAISELPEVLSLHPLGSALEIARERLLQVGGMPALWASGLDQADVREELAP